MNFVFKFPFYDFGDFVYRAFIIVEDASSRVFYFIPFLSCKKLIATSQTLSLCLAQPHQAPQPLKGWVSKGGVLLNPPHLRFIIPFSRVMSLPNEENDKSSSSDAQVQWRTIPIFQR